MCCGSSGQARSGVRCQASSGLADAYGHLRVGRNAGLFTALPGGRRARMAVGEDVLEALEEAAAEQERARQEGVTRRDRAGRAEETGLSVPNVDASAAAQAG